MKKNKEINNDTRLNRIKKISKIIGNVGFFSFVGLLVLLSVVIGIDTHAGYTLPIFGYRSSVIVSTSMATVNEANTYITPEMKQLQVYDVVTTHVYKDYDSIQLYDILSYTSGNVLICHRVVDKYESDGVQYIVTRGDANSGNDTPFNFSLVRGKVVSITPKIGKFILFMQSGYVTLAICGTLFFVFLGMFIYSYKDKSEKKQVLENNNKVVDVQEPSIEDEENKESEEKDDKKER